MTESYPNQLPDDRLWKAIDRLRRRVSALFETMREFPIEFRSATQKDALALTALRWRSKGHWGYDPEWVRRVEGEVSVPDPASEQRRLMFVLQHDGVILGFYSLILQDRILAELDDFFIDRPYIARGFGRLLWQDAVRRSREWGHIRLKIIADPNAAGFYLKQGARREGETVSRGDASRILPVLFYDLLQ